MPPSSSLEQTHLTADQQPNYVAETPTNETPQRHLHNQPTPTKAAGKNSAGKQQMNPQAEKFRSRVKAA
jgi:hypothetical protein